MLEKICSRIKTWQRGAVAIGEIKMTFTQKNRAFWAENLRAVKAVGRTPAGHDLAHQKSWALRCLAMAGPVGKLPA